jgi:chemotaxis protein methyltransferase CheR
MYEQLQLIRQSLSAVGLRLRDQDREALSRWVEERRRAHALPGLEEYVRLLSDDSASSRRERELITVRFSTGESYFFRDQGQIDLLATTILPQLLERRADTRTLRIWSAGCAAGEEAYTLAILVDELAPRLDGWKVLILGSDINTQALEKARRGEYREWAFRTLDDARRQRYFERHGDRWRIARRLREQVTFCSVDLVHAPFPDPAAGLNDFDLILCRNVFIYLDTVAAGRITTKFARTLAGGGYLITGHNELFGHDTAPLRVHMYAQSAVFEKNAQPGTESGPGASLARVRMPAIAASAPAPRVEAQAPQIERRVAAIEVPPPVNGRAVAQAPPAATAADCERLIESARRHADRGRPDAAAADCRKAIAVSGFDPRPYFLLAQLAQERGDANEAKTLLKKVIYLDPSFVAAYLELGALHAQAGESGSARRMYASVRTALAKLPPQTVIAPYSESSAANVLAYVERLLDARAGAGSGGAPNTAQLTRSA